LPWPHNRSYEATVGVTWKRSYAHEQWKAAEMTRLLLIGNHTLFRQCLALLLEWQTGLGSVQAGSLAEAQRALSDMNDKPACVIINLELLNGNGVELLEQLRELPVLALAPSRSLKHRPQALEAGADEVLPVADSAERIVAAVKRLVDEY
jgi:DNA-binding NarL/FixJ family response regulator